MDTPTALYHVGERALPPGEPLRPNAVPRERADLLDAVDRALAGWPAGQSTLLSADEAARLADRAARCWVGGGPFDWPEVLVRRTVVVRELA